MTKNKKLKPDPASTSGDSLLSTEGSGKKRGIGRGKHPNSRKGNANLKPFPKGLSGNPGGLPGTDVAARIARLVFEIDGAQIAAGMAKQLRNGTRMRIASLLTELSVKSKTRLSSAGQKAERLS